MNNKPIPTQPVSSKKRDTFALIALVLSILSLLGLFLFFIDWVNPLFLFPLGIPGIVFGILGKKSLNRKKMAITGLILSLPGTLVTFWLTFTIIEAMIYVSNHREGFELFQELVQ